MTTTTAAGPTPALLKAINAAFNGRDGETLNYRGCDLYEFRGDRADRL